MRQRRNFGLDVVRMCAIIPVMIVHFTSILLHDVWPIVYVVGDMGVEIFFALSGFLIGGIILRDFRAGFSTRGATVFYVRRWMRTLPLYYLFLIANLFITAYGFMADPAISAKSALYPFFLQNLHWPLIADWYQESWSLAVEEWFYLLFPIIFVALPGLAPKLRVLGVAIILIVVPLALRLAAADAGNDYHTVWRTVSYRLDAIAFGILAVWIVTEFPAWSRYWRNVIGIAGVAGIALSIMTSLGIIYTTELYRMTYAFSLVSVSFAAIVLWASQKDWSTWEAGGEVRVIRWFSTRSYALYLCHGLIIRAMVHAGIFGLPHLQSTALFIAATFTLAEVLHRLIELPFMRLRPAEIITARDEHAEIQIQSQLRR